MTDADHSCDFLLKYLDLLTKSLDLFTECLGLFIPLFTSLLRFCHLDPEYFDSPVILLVARSLRQIRVALIGLFVHEALHAVILYEEALFLQLVLFDLIEVAVVGRSAGGEPRPSVGELALKPVDASLVIFCLL